MRVNLLKPKYLIPLLVLFGMLVVAASGLFSYYGVKGVESFIDGVKACDRDNDCSDGYTCNTQTCVKTKEYKVD